MIFLDWVGFVGNAIQTFYSWACYNRSSFTANVSMRQSQKYQQKNYHIAWVAVARDDIRDMMGISVNRINNYMIVATLILGIATGALTSVSFVDRDPDFLVYAFFTSIGTSIVFLMVSIMFGVKGQNCAFTNTMKLLTYEVRPENPADYNHDYMKQSQWIEKRGFLELFRIPGTSANYKTEKIDAATVSAVEKKTATAEDLTPLESLEIKSDHLWYLTKFSNFSRLWLPYDTHAKFVMGLGIIALGHGSAYFALAKLIVQNRKMSSFSACALTASFAYMVVLVTHQNFKFKFMWLRWLVAILLVGSPIAGTIGAATESADVIAICAPVCFFCHFVFYLAAFFLAQNDFADAKLAKGKKDIWSHHASPTPANSRNSGNSREGEKEEESWEAEKSVQNWDDRPEYVHTGVDGRSYNVNNGMPTDGGAGEWPTESDEFEDKVRATTQDIRSAVRASLFMSFLLWFGMFCWSIEKYWNPFSMAPAMKGSSLQTSKVRHSSIASAADVAVRWGDAFFRPHLLACAGGHIFAADRFNLFELVDGSMVPRVCRLNHTIVDIAAACDGRGQCRPFALVRDTSFGAGASRVVDCDSGRESVVVLRGVDAAVDRIAYVSGHASGPDGDQLLASHGGMVDLFQRRPGDGRWDPEWRGALSPSADILSLAAVRLHKDTTNHILVFRENTITVHDAESLEELGTWALPSRVGALAGGCAVADGSKTLALSRSGPPGEDPAPRLVEITMPGSTANISALAPPHRSTAAHLRSKHKLRSRTFGTAMLQFATELGNSAIDRAMVDEEEDAEAEL
mmetsp:Transcript_82955/g.231410  ORF Transcript_82955/g.231410 Transcript_82955/m.231410 type:complete len:798 (+) Transcript_82955:114-2507(+)